MALVMADDLFLGISDIDGGFEDLHLLLGELRTAQTADQFLRLTRKHRAANDLDSARTMHFTSHISRHLAAKLPNPFKNCKVFAAFFVYSDNLR